MKPNQISIISPKLNDTRLPELLTEKNNIWKAIFYKNRNLDDGNDVTQNYEKARREVSVGSANEYPRAVD